jgi:hypothetical protein
MMATLPAASPEPRVYLLHFDRPLAHARHYVGVALDGNVDRRLAEHLAGQGSPLVRAVVAAGIRVDLVLSAQGDRKLERRWHNRHGSRICPRCNAPRQRTRQYRLPFPSSAGGPKRPPFPRSAISATSISLDGTTDHEHHHRRQPVADPPG